MARRPFVRGRNTARRKTQWTSSPAETAFIALAAATSIFDLAFTTTGDRPETMARLRGLLTVMTDQFTATESPFGAVGMCVVSDEAAAVGITAMPKPYTDAESDLWLFHQYWSAPVSAPTAVGMNNVAVQYLLDSKAMRKVNEDETLVGIIQNGSAANGALFRWDIRILSIL